MKVSSIKKEELTDEIVDKMLFNGLEDSGDPGDCIMVLGSNKATKYRIPKAVYIYKEDRATKLLLCGGSMHETDQGNLSEAELMRRKALELGVLERDIIIEDRSLTTKENMICALLPLERVFTLSMIRKILLVTTTYHMRRCLKRKKRRP